MKEKSTEKTSQQKLPGGSCIANALPQSDLAAESGLIQLTPTSDTSKSLRGQDFAGKRHTNFQKISIITPACTNQ